MIRVMLADDHDLVRTGLRRLLEDVNGIEVVAEATTGEQAVSLSREHRPQVVLMDINMPGMGGLEATKKIIHTDDTVKVIVVTMNEDEVLAQTLLKAGAAGYLTKGCLISEIVHAIKEVIANRRYITPQIATQLALAGTRPDKAQSPFHDLSERELQVMLMTLDGRKTNEISDSLCLSPKTISTYRHRLFAKLGIQTDVELTRLAIKHGLTKEQA
ncbi:MAG: UvrY/SirA/GacA family response regulator transcription factor [Gammaproteobacteria bacterium]|nr:UvrY/SirA/GacA family response regulator transcription factor [Gammaproteobacteria bacterium]